MLLLVAVTFGRRHDTQPNDTKLNDAQKWAEHVIILLLWRVLLCWVPVVQSVIMLCSVSLCSFGERDN